MNLGTLSLKELKQLQRDIERSIKSFEERQRKEAVAKLDAVAREMGYTLADLIGAPSRAPSRRRRSRGEPRYANPDNPSQTWTGMGRKPGWMIKAI